MTTSYKLNYFPLRARGELARMVLNAAGQDFENNLVQFADWPTIKPTMPTGQMPVLEFNGQKLSQSMAIARYLAREFGFAGKTNLEQALVDQVADTVGDLFQEFVKCRFEKDEAKKPEMFKKYFDETVPKFLGILTKFLEQNNGGSRFFVGDSLTLADMAVYEVLETLQKKEAKCVDKFPKLIANKKLVAQQPRLDNYLKTRPESDI